MKTLNISLTMLIALIGSLLFFGCEDPVDKEFASSHSPTEGYGIPPQKPFPYVKQVIKQDFRDAKGWRIIWGGGEVKWSSDDVYKIPAIFSTINGAVNSTQFLNNTSPLNTDNADMWIYFSLNATSNISSLDYDTHTKKTRFKLSGMTVTDLQNAAENNPSQFYLAYEWDLDEPTGALTIGNYKVDQIFTFKTDRTPAKYGAIRIVDKMPLTVEVVVQK